MTRHADKNEHFICHAAADLIGGLDPQDRRELKMLKKRLNLKPGNFLVKTGEMTDRIFVHRSGMIQTIPLIGFDRYIDRRDGESEFVYGMTEALSGKGFEFSIKSISNAEFDVIEKSDLIEFIRHRPELIHQLSVCLSALYERALEKLRDH